ncbi:MAG: zinc-ribbon domain-containing protein [Lachnospiraceae bacterium]|nr:zinc-ribbon domain-containing protein [Lachnospiraceae bacterium]
MFCTSCGSEIADGVKFCTNCGAPIVPVSQAPQMNEAVQETAAQTAEEASNPFAQMTQEAPKAPDYNPFEPESSTQQTTQQAVPPVVPVMPQYQQNNEIQQEVYTQQQDYTQQNAYVYDEDGTYVQDASKMKTKTALIVAYLLGIIGWLIAWFAGDRKDPLLRFHLNQLLVLDVINLLLTFFDDFDVIDEIAWIVRIFLVVCWFIGFIGALKGEKKGMPLLSKITLIQQ